MLTWLLFMGLAVLLALAALVDLRERRIPNWLTMSVAALYPIYVLAGPPAIGWPGALVAASTVFLLGLALFARGLIGGGDVKLIAATALWAGLDHLALFALVTSLVGGALAMGGLFYRRWHGVIGAHMAALGWNLTPVFRGSAPTGSGGVRAPSLDGGEASRPIEPPRLSLPYGVAIAAGGFAVIVQLAKL